MVDIIVFSKFPQVLSHLKETVMRLIGNQEYTLEVFLYVMDMMDYIYAVNPKKFIVLYCEQDAQSGIEIAEKLYEINNKGRFCLLSSREPEDVEKLFYAGISYFIQSENDINEESIGHCFQRFCEYYDDSFGRMLTLKNQSGSHTIPLSQIEYVMSDKRKVIVYDKESSQEFYYKLDEIETMTEGIFLRCHQSYLVNMKKIKAFVQDGLMMESGCFVPVSRKKYFQAKRTYLSYIAGNSEIITD